MFIFAPILSVNLLPDLPINPATFAEIGITVDKGMVTNQQLGKIHMSLWNESGRNNCTGGRAGGAVPCAVCRVPCALCDVRCAVCSVRVRVRCLTCAVRCCTGTNPATGTRFLSNVLYSDAHVCASSPFRFCRSALLPVCFAVPGLVV